MNHVKYWLFYTLQSSVGCVIQTLALMLYWLANQKLWNLQHFLKISLAVSRITEPILGLFVFVWMHFSC